MRVAPNPAERLRLQRRVREPPDVLQERRLEADDRDPGRDVEEEDEPHDRELARAETSRDGVGLVRVHRALLYPRGTGGVGRSLRRRRIAKSQTDRNQHTGEHDTEPGEKERKISLRGEHQDRGQHLAQQQGTHAETHDHDPGRESLAVRKPLGHGGHRGDVAEPDPGSPDDAIAEIEQPDDVQMKGEAGDDVASREHHASGQRQLPRPQPGQHRARPRRRHAERKYRNAERSGGLHERPSKLVDSRD